jgi:phospholipase C
VLPAAALAALSASAASCSDGKAPEHAGPVDAGDDADPRPPTPPEWDRSVVRPDEATASAERTACHFDRGALADETLGTSIPVGKDIPIDTIVVLMMENRSFDHYFSRFGRYAGRTDIEVAADDATNPETPVGSIDAGDDGGDAGSPLHARRRGDMLCFSDTDHSWAASHTQYDDGSMDGFWATNDTPGDPLRNGDRALWWYDEQEIPFYYALAKSFALGDHYHCALLAETWPNRAYLVAATSFGHVAMGFPDLTGCSYPACDAVVLDELDKRHVDFMLYTAGGPPATTIVVGPTIGTRWGRSVIGTIEDFEAAAAAGTLPPVAFVDPDYRTEGSADSEDEHPPGDIQVGQKFSARVVNAVMHSPQWNRAALFLTYDEHGGIYDHVPPPPACKPDSHAPMGMDGTPAPGAFDRLGFRVPFMVISPYAKRGYVSHDVLSHTSITRFIEARFRVPALTARDANSMIPIDSFDFGAPPKLDLPSLPEATVDPTRYADCQKTFPKK